MAFDCSGALVEDFYLFINCYGQFGTAFAETDLRRADLETIISDLMSGQHSDPLRVITFNPATDRAADVSQAIAREILRRLARHVNMANSPNASVTRMKIAAVVSDMSHIRSPDLSGPPHLYPASALTIG
jgi:hypothetical protein